MDKLAQTYRSDSRLKLAIFFQIIAVILVFCGFTYGQKTSGKQSAKKPDCTVVLKVVFLANGKIGPISTDPRTSCTDEWMTKKAMEAAAKIEFEPLKVDRTRTVEYTFTMEPDDPKETTMLGPAEAVIKRAVDHLGGDKYLNVKTQLSEGTFSVIRENRVVSYQTFTDAIIFPDTQRTDFKGGGVMVVQTNKGDSGWVYDGDQELIKDQTKTQLDNFRRGIRVSLDNLLRGGWKDEATLTYVGKRPSTLGKRNDVVKLTYKDGFAIEFEFSADEGIPQKSIYKLTNDSGEETTETELYAQWITVDGIKTPFIIDRRTNNDPASRINFDSVKFNKQISDSNFDKPVNKKQLKSLKF